MKNNSQMITARQGNRIMILEIFSAAAMFLPQIALQKSYHSGIVVVVMASVMAGIYLWIGACIRLHDREAASYKILFLLCFYEHY